MRRSVTRRRDSALQKAIKWSLLGAKECLWRIQLPTTVEGGGVGKVVLEGEGRGLAGVVISSGSDFAEGGGDEGVGGFILLNVDKKGLIRKNGRKEMAGVEEVWREKEKS